MCMEGRGGGLCLSYLWVLVVPRVPSGEGRWRRRLLGAEAGPQLSAEGGGVEG